MSDEDDDGVVRYGKGERHGILDGAYWGKVVLSGEGRRPVKPVENYKPTYSHFISKRKSGTGKRKVARQSDATIPRPRQQSSTPPALPMPAGTASQAGSAKRKLVSADSPEPTASGRGGSTSSKRRHVAKPTAPSSEAAVRRFMSENLGLSAWIKGRTRLLPVGAGLDVFWDDTSEWFAAHIVQHYDDGQSRIQYDNDEAIEVLDLRGVPIRTLHTHQPFRFVPVTSIKLGSKAERKRGRKGAKQEPPKPEPAAVLRCSPPSQKLKELKPVQKARARAKTITRGGIRKGALVWVKYGGTSSAVWPGVVRSELTDHVESFVCRQQALERMPRKSEAELLGERAWCIEWFNHYTKTTEEEVEQTTNEFLECELSLLHSSFKDFWRRRAKIKVGDPAHSGAYFNRAVYQALTAWLGDAGMPQLGAANICLAFNMPKATDELARFLEEHRRSVTMGDAMFKLEESLTQRWSCDGCSYLNEKDASTCSVCGTRRFSSPSMTSRDGRANARAMQQQENTVEHSGRRSTESSSGARAKVDEPTGYLGQGMSGSLTHRGVEQVLELMQLGPGDRFVDLGSGVGHVTLQAAEMIPSLDWSRGVECVEASWSVAWQRARDLEAGNTPVAPMYFHLGDLMTFDVEDLPEASHYYVFAAGMPPELQLHLCRLICKAPDVKKVAVVIDGKLGLGKTSLSTLLTKSGCFRPQGKLHTSMRGSGSGKTVIVYERLPHKK